MTPEQLQAIEKRAAKATRGPWHTSLTNHYKLQEPVVNAFTKFDKTEYRIATTYAFAGDPNAVFIAHAREDIPALVAAVRQRDARIAELEDAITDAWIGLASVGLGEDAITTVKQVMRGLGTHMSDPAILKRQGI